MQTTTNINELAPILGRSSSWVVRRGSIHVTVEVLQHAIEHGYCFFDELDEFEEPIHEEDYFGFGMTYGQYWAEFPEQRPEPEPTPKESRHRHFLLLLFDAPYLALQHIESTIYMVSDSIEHPQTQRPRPAILLEEKRAQSPGEDGPFPVNEVTPIQSGGIGAGWRLAETTCITTVSMPKDAQRLWDWRWPPTYGPALFKMELTQTKEQLEAWFHRLTLERYAEISGVLIRSNEPGPSLSQLYRLVEPGKYRLIGESNVGIDLYFADNLLELSHGTHFKPGQTETDATLLRSVIAGELGEVTCWRLIDGDYAVLCAAGRGTDSLKDYLDPNIADVALREQLDRYTLSYRPARCDSMDDLLALVANELGILREAMDSPRQSIVHWLKETQATELPVEFCLIWSLSNGSSEKVREVFRQFNELQRHLQFRVAEGYWD